MKPNPTPQGESAPKIPNKGSVEWLYKLLESARNEMEEMRDGETCDHSVGVCWCNYHGLVEEIDEALVNRDALRAPSSSGAMAGDEVRNVLEERLRVNKDELRLRQLAGDEFGEERIYCENKGIQFALDTLARHRQAAQGMHGVDIEAIADEVVDAVVRETGDVSWAKGKAAAIIERAIQAAQGMPVK